MKHDLIIDIETEGFTKEVQLSMFDPKIKADGRLKDEAKIEADRQEKLDEWAAKAALDAGRCRILAIGLYHDGVVRLLEGHEEGKLIKLLWDFLLDFDIGHIVGHNIKNFDLPMLIRRSYCLGIQVPNIVRQRDMVVDTMAEWAAGEWGMMISLDNLARALGVGKKSGSGADFSMLYHTDKQAALEYLKNDIILTKACAEKMGCFHE